MNSIPILSISDAFAASVAFISVWKLFFAWRETKQENLRYFLITYILMGFFFALLASPELIVHDPIKMQIIFSFSFIPLLLGLAFLLAIPFNILSLVEERHFLFMFVGTMIAIFMTLNFIFFRPAVSKTFGIFIYWTEIMPAWLINMEGGLAIILSLASSIFFLREGVTNSESAIRTRSLLIGNGILLLVMAAFFNYLVTPNLSFSVPIQVSIQIIVGLFLAAGFLILLAGILYKQTFARKENLPINSSDGGKY